MKRERKLNDEHSIDDDDFDFDFDDIIASLDDKQLFHDSTDGHENSIFSIDDNSSSTGSSALDHKPLPLLHPCTTTERGNEEQYDSHYSNNPDESDLESNEELEGATIRSDENVLDAMGVVKQDSTRDLQDVLVQVPDWSRPVSRRRKLKTIAEHTSVRSFSSRFLTCGEESDDDFVRSSKDERYQQTDDGDCVLSDDGIYQSDDNGEDHDCYDDDGDNEEFDNDNNSKSQEMNHRQRPQLTKATSSNLENKGSNTSIGLDKSIVKEVLSQADARERKLKREWWLNRLGCCLKKEYKKTLICLILTFGNLAVASSVLSYLYKIGIFEDEVIKEKNSNGGLGIYDDHSNYHNHDVFSDDLKSILGRPNSIDEDFFPSFVSQNLANVLKETSDASQTTIQKYNEHEIPFLWKTPLVGDDMERIFSDCYGFVMAKGGMLDDMVTVREQNPDELVVLKTYSGVADIFSSSQFQYVTNALFPIEDHKGQLFTMLRHPIDRTIVSYYKFITKLGKDDEQMSLPQYIQSSLFTSNWLTRTLSNVSSSSNPTLKDLDLAKEILRRKCLIGIYEDLVRSVDLFNNYFRWNHANQSKREEINQCVTNVYHESDDEKYLIRHKLEDRGYDIGIGGEIYSMIAQRNDFDMRLYWYAFDLHLAQVARINEFYTP